MKSAYVFSAAAAVAVLLLGLSIADGNFGVRGAAPQATRPPDPPAGWTYGRRRDEMRGTEWGFARLSSTTFLPLDFPYQPGTRATIILVESSENPRIDNVSTRISIERGQMACSETYLPYNQCTVFMTLDSGRVINLIGVMSDGDSPYLTLIYPHREYGNGRTPQPLAERLLQSRRAMLEFRVYGQGDRQFTFPTEGLQWPPPRSSPG